MLLQTQLLSKTNFKLVYDPNLSTEKASMKYMNVNIILLTE
jgi:hypothetical protein